MNWMYGDQTGVESTNTTNPVTRPQPTGGEVEGVSDLVCVCGSDWLAAYVQAARDEERARAWEDGVRQALAWLQADYPYGSGPDWRENGVDWIADRLAEHLARGGAR